MLERRAPSGRLPDSEFEVRKAANIVGTMRRADRCGVLFDREFLSLIFGFRGPCIRKKKCHTGNHLMTPRVSPKPRVMPLVRGGHSLSSLNSYHHLSSLANLPHHHYATQNVQGDTQLTQAGYRREDWSPQGLPSGVTQHALGCRERGEREAWSREPSTALTPFRCCRILNPWTCCV